MILSISVNPLRLERFILGELPPVERVELEKAISADPRLRQAVEDLRTSNAEILQGHPASAFRKTLRKEPVSRRQHHRLVLAASFGLAGLVLALGLSRGVNEIPEAPEITRVKGATSALRVFRKSGGSSEVLSSGARAVQGDLLRLGYQTPVRRFGMIVSIDGRNAVTRHWPASGSTAAPMVPGELILLDQAFELDNAPRFERFYLVTSDHAFAADLVLMALRSGGAAGGAHALALPEGFEQVSVELQKETPR